MLGLTIGALAVLALGVALTGCGSDASVKAAARALAESAPSHTAPPAEVVAAKPKPDPVATARILEVFRESQAVLDEIVAVSDGLNGADDATACGEIIPALEAKVDRYGELVEEWDEIAADLPADAPADVLRNLQDSLRDAHEEYGQMAGTIEGAKALC